MHSVHQLNPAIQINIHAEFGWFLESDLLENLGSEIALSWSPMRLKILHWRPEFHNWLPHFSIWRLKKNFHSPVGACRKKLISDPEIECIIQSKLMSRNLKAQIIWGLVQSSDHCQFPSTTSASITLDFNHLDVFPYMFTILKDHI